MDSQQKNDFSKGSIPRVIIKMALPLIVAQFINLLYSMVDRMYIGRIPGSSGLALTALGVCIPIVYIITAFANLCGTGGTPLCSIARGRGDLEQAELIMGNTFTMAVSIGILLTGALHLFLRPLLYAFGAGDDTIGFAMDYASIYCWGTLPVMVTLGMNGFITSQGFSRFSMLTVAIGAVVNIVLDPIFIFVLSMGVKGAALATVIAQTCSAAWVMRFLTGKRATLRFLRANLRPRGKLCGRIATLGVTGFIMASTNSLVHACSNVVLRRYGGDLYVGVMTVLGSVRELLIVSVSGLNSGAQPVIGFNYGAREYERVRACIRFVTVTGVSYSCIVWLLIMTFPETFVRIFSDDAAFIALCVPNLKIYARALCVMSFMFVGQCTFVGLGKSKFAITFSMMRKVGIVLPLLYTLPRLWDLGVTGAFLAEPISEVIGGCACYTTMMLVVYRGLKKHPERI